MKPILKSRESGVIFIVRLIGRSQIGYSTSQKARSSSCLYVYAKVCCENQRFSQQTRLQPYVVRSKKLKHNGVYLHMKYCTVKHLNNLIEQDHRHIKRPFVKSVGFQTLFHASRTIKGIEMIHAIYKQKRSHIPVFSFSTYKE